MLEKLKEILRRNTKYGRSRYLNYLYRYDMERYFAHSAMNQQGGGAIAAKIRLLVHALEKGLSVKNQKSDFGREKIRELLDLVEAYGKCDCDPDPQAVILAEAVIGSWAQNRIERGEDVSFLPERLLVSDASAGVTVYESITKGEFFAVAKNRHSVRTFLPEPVEKELLRNAVALAQTAPSACNRQATHVFVCLECDKIQKIIERHGGLRGFHNIGAILAVTGDLRLYQNEYERNTVFVDGGIFVMNLLYALDNYGLGACPVIWGAEPDNDRFLYDLLGIPENHEVISLVACGHYPEQSKVPCSTRRETNTVLHYIE